MPACICSNKCILPAADLHPRHRCPSCNEMIYSVCGVYDDSKEIHNNMWCFICYGGLKLPAKQTEPSSFPSDSPASPAVLPTNHAASLKPATHAQSPISPPHQPQPEATAQGPKAASAAQSSRSQSVPKKKGLSASSSKPAKSRKAETKKPRAPKKLKKAKAVQIDIPFEDPFLTCSTPRWQTSTHFLP